MIANLRIKRSAVKKDIIFFGIPALSVFTLGLIVCAHSVYIGIVSTLVNITKRPTILQDIESNKIIGIVVFLIGLSYAIIAVTTLKSNYSSTLVIREDHKLIKHGVYRFSRHPVYIGVLVACIIGIPVFSWSLPGFIVLSVLLPIVLFRIKIEENLLLKEFGKEYEDYKKSTKKLIPFIF